HYNFFLFSSRRRHTRFSRDWSSDVCSSDLFTRMGGEHFSAGLLDTVCADWRERLAYVCGPEALMDAVRNHWQNSQIESLKEEARSEERRVGNEWVSSRSQSDLEHRDNLSVL